MSHDGRLFPDSGHDAHFGAPGKPLPDWRRAHAGRDEEREEPTESERRGIIGVLGFDPDEADDNSAPRRPHGRTLYAKDWRLGPLADDALHYAKSSAVALKAAGGKLVSARSKTQEHKCSQAVSNWKTGNDSHENQMTLAWCRALARTRGQAAAHRNAGNEAKAQTLEHRAQMGKVGIKARNEQAARKRSELVQRRAARTPGKITPHADAAQAEIDAAKAQWAGRKPWPVADVRDTPEQVARARAAAARAESLWKAGFSANKFATTDPLGRPVAAGEGLKRRESGNWIVRHREDAEMLHDRETAQFEAQERALADRQGIALRVSRPGASQGHADRTADAKPLPPLPAETAPSIEDRIDARRRQDAIQRQMAETLSQKHARLAAARAARSPAPALSDADFAERARQAARSLPEGHPGRFGSTKVFINHAHAAFEADPANPRMSLDEFKKRLVEGHVGGKLQLSRADLVEAMDKGDVRASEAFHPLTPVKANHGNWHLLRTGEEPQWAEPAAAAPRPSLRDQAAAHRAAKGDTTKRAAGLKLKAFLKAAKLKEEEPKVRHAGQPTTRAAAAQAKRMREARLRLNQHEANITERKINADIAAERREKAARSKGEHAATSPPVKAAPTLSEQQAAWQVGKPTATSQVRSRPAPSAEETALKGQLEHHRAEAARLAAALESSYRAAPESRYGAQTAAQVEMNRRRVAHEAAALQAFTAHERLAFRRLGLNYDAKDRIPNRIQSHTKSQHLA
ncbi:MAG TPA: hypothetical protein PLB88_04680 [Thermoanaerobaculaceae bacterium]|nr:hypothetical protein [Thermoanaerobaculaceae bacterium]